MAEFPVNVHRFDPYKNFKFVVKWNGRAVAGINKVSALKRSTEANEYRQGGDPSHNRVSPSVWKFEPITLERGVTHDPEFESWANLVYQAEDVSISMAGFRRDIQIELLNEAASPVLRYNVYRCWVSEYQALPELDSNSSAVAIESIVIQHEGWVRDLDLPETLEG